MQLEAAGTWVALAEHLAWHRARTALREAQQEAQQVELPHAAHRGCAHQRPSQPPPSGGVAQRAGCVLAGHVL